MDLLRSPEIFLFAMFGFIVITFRMFFDHSYKKRELDIEEKKLELDKSIRQDRQLNINDSEKDELRKNSGAGSGGYIILDIPNNQRPMFHDLLKG